ncbi:MAG: mismatch repair protein MutS, partial [Cohnella sp.]|nr:mismatch repair protein MutS [Cohnella sp.]
AGSGTLVLLDELAAGTDPGEGVGLSIAVLEELYRRGSVILATTHFNEIKEYARITPGFRNARMAFDEETLKPLYRLDMGEAGNSYAFVIAAKLGIPPAIVDRARTIADVLKQGKPASTPAIPIKAPDHTADGRSSDQEVRKERKGEKSAESASAEQDGIPKFEVGDVVFIPHMRRTGVIYRLADERGNLIVQVQEEKRTINHKRVRRYIERQQLYPGDDYDMDIVFESVDNRKKRKQMGKRHVPGMTIEKPSEDG